MTDSTIADIGPSKASLKEPHNEPNKQKIINSSKQRLIACAHAGLFRHAVDKQYQGLGNTFIDLINAHQALGLKTRDPGLILAINAHLWGAVFQIQRFGTSAQKSTWLPALLNGEIISGHAITEPNAGSNVSAMTTSYQTTADGFIINGHKRYITNTPIASMMVVYAKQHDTDQICAFMIKSTDPGSQFKDTPCVTGCETASMGDIILSDCLIPASRLLGKPGAGNTMIQLSLELERAFIFSGITGVMQWQLKQAINHARSRDAEKGKLAQHQAISHKIAMMKLRLDTSRLWIMHCAELLDSGKRITSASAQAKLYASEAFLQSSLDAVQILGASGLIGELTSLVNDALAGRLMSGSSEIQKNIIASMLGVSASANA